MDSSTNSSAVQSPLLRAASEPVPDADDASAVGSATYSEASSNDLALAPNASKHSAMGLRANTSFPGLGAAEAGTEANSVARPRVDAAKLALYQSKLNARLDAENTELKKERDQLLAKLAAFEQATGQADGEMLEQVRNELQQESSVQMRWTKKHSSSPISSMTRRGRSRRSRAQLHTRKITPATTRSNCARRSTNSRRSSKRGRKTWTS